ncbi:hypothetical protein D6810_01375, partial [Candidatus Dojkabacteria bacterium]
PQCQPAQQAPQCNQACTGTGRGNCADPNHICYNTGTGTVCRLASNPTNPQCQPAQQAPQCNQACTGTGRGNCADPNHICYNTGSGTVCRLASNPTDPQCRPINATFSLVKSAVQTCTSQGSLIVYNITVTNISQTVGTVSFLEDNIDTNLVILGISPQSLNPPYGSYSAGVIRWVPPDAERNYAPGQSRSFTYSILIPNSNLPSFLNSQVYNRATLNYGSNSISFDLRTPVQCIISIPVTNIPTSFRTVLVGSMIILLGMFLYISEFGRKISSTFYLLTIGRYSHLLKDFIIPEHKRKSTLERIYKRKIREVGGE